MWGGATVTCTVGGVAVVGHGAVDDGGVAVCVFVCVCVCVCVCSRVYVYRYKSEEQTVDSSVVTVNS